MIYEAVEFSQALAKFGEWWIFLPGKEVCRHRPEERLVLLR